MIAPKSPEMQLGGVYKIVHAPTGLYYLGSTYHFYKRFLAHRRELRGGWHMNRRLQGYWTKRGEQEFEFQIVEITQDLLKREQYYLDLWKPYEREIGFNHRRTARGFSSADTKQTLLTYWANLSPEKRAQREAQLRKMSPKGPAALRRRIKEDPELYALFCKIAVKARAVPRKRWNTNQNPEVNARVSQTVKKLWENPEYRAKIEAKIEERQDRKPEINSRIAETVKKRWTDPAYRAKRPKKYRQVQSPDAKAHGKARRTQKLKALWKTSEYRANVKAGRRKRSPEASVSFSRKMQALWANPEWRANQIAKISHPHHPHRTRKGISKGDAQS